MNIFNFRKKHGNSASESLMNSHAGFFLKVLTGLSAVTAVSFILMLSNPAEAADHGRKATGHYSYTCKVIRVHDGDTFRCLDGKRKEHKIRLINIDAPEKTQQYGEDATSYLKSRILKKDITVQVSSKDKYRRELALIFVNGTNINKEMVATGNAWAFRKYLPEHDRKEYINLESGARSAKRGLWKYQNPVEPSEYRKAHRSSQNTGKSHGSRNHDRRKKSHR